MTELRFLFLLREIRFYEANTKQEHMKTDRFAHIRDLWDATVAHCTENYKPMSHLAVDE